MQIRLSSKNGNLSQHITTVVYNTFVDYDHGRSIPL